MTLDSKHISAWQKARRPRFPSLRRSGAFDVVVIGAGITGLTAAYLLKRAGKKVCVLERERIGAVDTGHTTAHLTHVTDLRLSKLVKNFGHGAAKAVWLGGVAAINTIEALASELEADCQFRRVPGFLHASLEGERDERSDLQGEAELARELGFDARFLESVPCVGKAGIRFSDQAKFHPLKYLAALARAVHGNGSAIYEQSDASEVQDDPLAVVVGDKSVQCDYVIIATHVPLMGKAGLVSATLFQTKLASYSSYVIGATLPKGAAPEASYWDTTDPYYYLRIDAGAKADYAIFGGKDHKTGQVDHPDDRYERLAERLHELLPEAKVDCRWSGQVVETNDGLPYIGETAERQFAATGFAGNGMTFGTLAAMMACDNVLNQENPWRELFSPYRKKLRGGAWDYLKENLDYPYYLLRDRFARAEGESTRAVRRGEGKVLNLEGQRVACYRDDEGALSTVSAVCTHMGCLVRWNGAEKTWDCPCHGSRFHATGEVFAGPAETPLEKVEPKKKAARKKAKAAPAASAQKKKPRRQDSGGPGASRKSASRRSR